jgi:hypothetical protein
LFPEDHTRFFLGRVDAYEAGIARVTGYSYGRDTKTQNITRKPEIRTKIVPVVSGSILVYCLPDEMSVEQATIEATDNGLCLLCPPTISLNLSEWFLTH